MPEHDLEPPRFSRKALECLLGDWKAVQSMIMSGTRDVSETQFTDQPYVSKQTGTALLDKFSLCFLVKCQMVIDVLLETLIREMKNPDAKQAQYATMVSRRFVRSVVRIFVVFTIEMAPNSTKRRSLSNQNQPLTKCRKIFQSLSKLSIEELCESADAIMAPVRLGVARPTAPFSLATSANDILNVRPTGTGVARSNRDCFRARKSCFWWIPWLRRAVRDRAPAPRRCRDSRFWRRRCAEPPPTPEIF
jgi:E3 ubiquitin-protein ligase EDD1